MSTPTVRERLERIRREAHDGSLFPVVDLCDLLLELDAEPETPTAELEQRFREEFTGPNRRPRLDPTGPAETK